MEPDETKITGADPMEAAQNVLDSLFKWRHPMTLKECFVILDMAKSLLVIQNEFGTNNMNIRKNY